MRYLLHRRQRNKRKQEDVTTRKVEAKASPWNKFRRIHVPEWFRRWTTNKKPLSILLTCILLGGLGLSLAAYPVYGLLKTIRAEQLLNHSRELHDKGQKQQAFRRAHASYMLNPHSLEGLRWLCEVADSIGYHELIEWRRKLVDDPRSEPGDRIELIRAALSNHQPQLAEEVIRNLRASDVDANEYRYLQLLTSLSQGRAAKPFALAQCREILSYPKAPVEVYRIYWSLCLDSLDPRFNREAITHMEKTVLTGGKVGLAALRVLLQLPNQDDSKRNLHAQMLWEHPMAQRHDLLLSLRSAFFGQALPKRALRAVLDKQYDRLDETELMEISTILNDLGLHENAADLLPMQTMTDQKELWAEWVRAKIGSKQIKEAASVLQEQAPFSESEYLFLHSLLLRKNGEAEEADLELHEALRLAKASDLPILRKFVLLHEDKDTLVALLKRLAKEPQLRHWASALLILTLQRAVDAEPLVEALSSMQIEEYGNDPETANRLSRLKALHGQDLNTCRKIAEQLVARYPEIREYRFTLALVYQESNRPKEALRLLEGMLSTNPTECPTQRLIGARALLANGFSSEANKLVDGLQDIKLLPAERRILDHVLAKTNDKVKLDAATP
ncbi:MAG: hypothetical protein VCA36_01650 [Opitutales bacterium]